jgi:thioredoxin 1
MSEFVKNVTEFEFDEVVLKNKKPVLVDFYAVWCAPCRMQAPVLDELARDLSDKVSFCKVNVDEAEKLAINYGISSIPALLVFKDGKVVEKSVGLTPKADLASMVIRHL